MTTRELIELLEDIDPDGECEVRLMMQPEYPFEYSIAGLQTKSELNRIKEDNDPDEEDDDDEFDGEDVVYILEERQLGPGNKNAWNNPLT